MQELWWDPATWDAALAECEARYPPQAVTIDGASWLFLDTDAGKGALLLLPGAMGFAATAFHFLLAFAPQMRVISVSYPPTLTDGERLVDGLAALLTARGVEQAHVVGGSYSGLVAQRLAERHPGRVASLILANTWAADPQRARYFRPAAWLIARLPGWLLQRLMASYMDNFLPGADLATLFWRNYFQAILPAFTPALVAGRLRTFANLDAADWSPAPNWPGPVQLVESSDDRLFGDKSRLALRSRYPQAQVVELNCAGHAAALTHIEEYGRVYWDWLVSMIAVSTMSNLDTSTDGQALTGNTICRPAES